MGFHKLSFDEIDPKLFDKGIPELRREVNGSFEALGSILILMQLSINTTTLAPQLPRLGHILNLLPPNLQNLPGLHIQPKGMNPFGYKPAGITPLLHSFNQQVTLPQQSIMQVILPIPKLIDT